MNDQSSVFRVHIEPNKVWKSTETVHHGNAVDASNMDVREDGNQGTHVVASRVRPAALFNGEYTTSLTKVKGKYSTQMSTFVCELNQWIVRSFARREMEITEIEGWMLARLGMEAPALRPHAK